MSNPKQISKTERRKFNKTTVQIYRCDNGCTYFNTADVAAAIGYKKVSGIDYHIKYNPDYDVTIQTTGGGFVRVLNFVGINFLSQKATKSPLFKLMVDWARDIATAPNRAETIAAAQVLSVGSLSKLTASIAKIDTIAAPAVEKPKRVRKSRSKAYIAPPEEHFGIKEAATKLSMNTVELSNWLIENGYANRYKGNNALYLEDWFKDNKYGLLPVLPANSTNRERLSNVPRITQSGITFISNRLKSEREANLLTFSKKTNDEKETLESKMDDLIKESFKNNLDVPGFYWVSETDLLKLVRQVVAQVVVK